VEPKKHVSIFLFFKAMKEKALYMLASQVTPTYGVGLRSFSNQRFAILFFSEDVLNQSEA